MKKRGLSIGIVIILVLGLMHTAAFAQDEGGSSVASSFVGQIPAPDFFPGLEWLNVPAPLTLEQLRGKVVLLDFWTYGCINCIHMIPTLERLEEKYADELIIIGVHSAKFANEGETDNIRQIVQRYDLRHPVINDKDFLVWRTYGVNAWPTFVLIDPRGGVLARQGGEIPFDAFDRVIGGMVEYFDSLGEINRDPIDLTLEGATTPGQALSFPGKVRVDIPGSRLFIADSNHHRIVIADLATYKVLDVIGTGQRGFSDGDFETAMFNKPQGMEIDGDTLYIADTNNHTIRAVDLLSRTVTTIAGTGDMGVSYIPPGTVLPNPVSVDLRSPWDVRKGNDDTLYIAMAGTHQIWGLNLATNTLIISVVGDGREALLNDSLIESQLAQPSGLYYTDGLLYFADSESSSIRVADFNQDLVRTIAGPSTNTLFDFGDLDGKVGDSRLQHALGVTGAPDGTIYIADTYNSKIKAIDPQTTETVTLFGIDGDGAFIDGGADQAAFDEPGGLDYAELPDGSRRLYVADTNNHAIRVIDLEAMTVTTLAFPNPEKLQIADEVTVIGGNSAQNTIISLPEQALTSGTGEIVLKLSLPDGYKINDLTDSTLSLSSTNGAVEIASENAITLVAEKEIRVSVNLTEGSDTVYADLTLYYCEAIKESLCFIDSVVIEAPVTVAPVSGFETTILLEREIVPPVSLDTGGF